MKIFIITPVRNGVPQNVIEQVEVLERGGDEVYFPPRDTDQSDNVGYEICCQNRNAILASDEVWVYYSPESQGTHFDLGMAFALKKPVRWLNQGDQVWGENKSFPKMIQEWHIKTMLGEANKPH